MMKVVGLNGKYYSINLKKFHPKNSKKSSYHLAARSLLKSIFKNLPIYEEVKLPGAVNPAKKSALFLDFFIPSASLAIEVHGRQHFEFTPYFHKSRLGFLESKHRDCCKANWCELNNLDLIILRFDQPVDEWKAIVLQSLGKTTEDDNDGGRKTE